MTLISVFIRKVLNHSEMVFASDSRLSGGQRLDCAQKIFQFARSDALIAFAGDTDYAYPLLMQIQLAVLGYPYSADRRLPLSKLKGHALRVFQQAYDSIHGLPFGESHPRPPDNYFLLGGYDWQAGGFRAWRLAFDGTSRRFTFRPILGPKGDPFFFAGDDRAAVVSAIRQTRQLVHDRGKLLSEIDMEPYEALQSVIGDPQYDTIGGAPQVGKAYAHLNTQLFKVVWTAPDGERRAHVAGRPLLDDEKSNLPQFDPALGFFSVRGSVEGVP